MGSTLIVSVKEGNVVLRLRNPNAVSKEGPQLRNGKSRRGV